MRLDDIVLRYQKIIGNHDKQKWEKTLEQKILESALNFPLRSTKLKTELIDVDLVRGSYFQKLKPKQSLLTVLYLSVIRYLFLPLYTRWWVIQTSGKVFMLLLTLYVLQMINWAIYSLHINKVLSPNAARPEEESTVPLCELLIPMGLSMLLCFVHSQIVATSSANSSATSKGRQKFGLNKKGSEKVRRKKKILRQRLTNNSIDAKTQCYDSDDDPLPNNYRKLKSNLKFAIEPVNDRNHQRSFKAANSNEPCCSTSQQLSTDPPAPTLRKRNVNWDSPIKSSENVQQKICSPILKQRRMPLENQQPRSIEDDGFESLTGKSSSGEDTNNVNQQNLPKERQQSSASDTETLKSERSTPVKVCRKNTTQKLEFLIKKKSKESSDTDEENDDPETLTPASSTHQFETTDGEYIAVTSNSETECSVDHSEDDDNVEFDVSPANILSPNVDSSEKVSCTLWTKHDAKKTEMSVLDISSAIIARVDLIPESGDYVYIGLALSFILALTPTYCRLCDMAMDSNNSTGIPQILLELPRVMMDESSSPMTILHLAFGQSGWEKILLIIATFQRLVLAFLFFFLLAVAERTFKQRFLYAKLFSHLTSSRRAKKSSIPHFRLDKVRNIKAWLSVRSYLKRLGPQRSVDVIVSAAFITTLVLLAFLSLEFLKDSEHIHSQINLEALMWSCALGAVLLRFMTLGAKINKKYRSISVLITEQINLYVQMEKKSWKKEELSVANSVLKLASDLLKELDSPFKISGLSANSYLYNTVKVVVLSALSGVLSEMLGFKLKLHKIKIK